MFCVECGSQNPDSGAFCWKCGKPLFRGASPKRETSAHSLSLPPPGPADRASPSPTRDKNKLIVPTGAVLPGVCVKCGAAGIPQRYKFAWLDPGYFALALLGIAPYFILRLFLRKTVDIFVPLCPDHYRRARNLGIAGIISLVLAVPIGIGLGALLSDPDALVLAFFCGFSLFIIGVLLIWAHYPLRAVRIDDNSSTFRGASETFLRLLPTR